MLYILIFILGLIAGSFLNVCIIRIPMGASILTPQSRCPECSVRLRPWDLIPLLSWFFLKGKCRYCAAPVSVQYPLVELLTAVLFIFLYSILGLTNYLASVLVLTSILIVISFIDLKYFIIPNRIIIAGFILGLISHLIFPAIPWLDFLLGFFIGGGSLFLLALLSKGGMGGGDIKLAALIGFYLGWQKVLLALFFGAFLGSVTGLVLLLSKKITRKEPIPFGPFLSFGVIFAIWISALRILGI